MSQKIDYLDKVGISYLARLIRNSTNLTQCLDDNNIRQDGTFTSFMINNLLTNLKTDLQNDYRSLISNLNRLKKLVVTSLPTTNIDVDTLYMLKKTDTNGNEYFEQYLYLNGNFELVATTKVADSKGLEIYDSNKQYVINDTVLYKGTTDTYYSVYICKNPTTGTFVDSDWEVVDEQQKFLIIDSTQPSNTNVFWIDTTDSTKPLLKFYDTTNSKWVSISSSGSSSGISQYADYSTLPLASQGSTSSDLVDNKIVFCNDDYTDTATGNKYPKGFYKYISADDNWIEIYKFDFDEGVRQLKNYIVEANLRTYTGEELDYFFATGIIGNAATDVNMLSKLTNVTTNMDNSTISNYVKLEANKTYFLEAFILILEDGNGFCFKDSEGNKYGTRSYKGVSNGTWDYSMVVATIQTNKDMYITIENTLSRTFSPDCCYIKIEEANRQVIIDPSQICEEQQGIEAVPVGNVIELAGTKAPTHYLLCDGSEYNIADYPKLAQHFLDDYGSVNYFGGDGITTFAVPLYEIIYDSIVPQMTGYSQDGYVASASSEYDSINYVAWKAFDKYTSTEDSSSYKGSWATAHGQTTGWVQIQIPSPRKIKKYTLRARNILNDPTSITSFVDFQLLGSNDGITWDTLHSATNEPTWSMNEQREYNVSTNNYYSYYRLNVSKISGTPYVDIDEIDLIGCTKIYCIKAEPSYYIDNSTIGDTIAPNPSNTETDFRLDITHKGDGTVETTPNLRGRDAVYVPTNGFYGLHVENGSLILECQDGATPPPLALEIISGQQYLTYDTDGTIQGTLIS